jgi:dephospho-CoA kinase
LDQQLIVRLLIAVVGQAGAGKTTFIEVLAQQFCAPTVSFGGFVRDEAQRRGLPLDRPTLQSLGQQLIATYGSANFARLVVASHAGSQDLLLIDGVRSVEVWETVRVMAQRTVLIYLDVPDTVRAARIAERDQQDRSIVAMIMQHPLELSVPALRPYADLVSRGENIDQLVAQVASMVRE